MSNKNNVIIIKGANENNLKNVSLTIPKNKLILFTGLSGSGKSSLAFDTIYEEGRRRYVDSLSSYARQFLGGTKKPSVDSIEGLSPAISIEQKTTHSNPRSTVGTITEIYDYLRLLFAKIGKPFCPKHKIEISSQKIKDIIDSIYENPIGSKLMILAPIVKGQKGTNVNLFNKLKQDGFLRVKVDDVIYSLDDEIVLEKNKKHNIDIVVDRVVLDNEQRERITESIVIALEKTNGLVEVEIIGKEIKKYSQQFSCVYGDFQMPKIETKLFSFNSPYGMCEECKGIGVIVQPDIDLIIPKKNISIEEGAIDKMPGMSSLNPEGIVWQEFIALMNHYKIPLNVDIEDLNENQLDIIKYGSKEEIEYVLHSKDGRKYERKSMIEGLITKLNRLYLETSSDEMRQYYTNFMSEIKCGTCNNKRLNKYALAVRIEDLNIHELSSLSIEDAYEFIINLKLNSNDEKISKMIINELTSRLGFLKNVGLEYLTLTRTAETLSGGEAQRIRLATQIGSKLTGILYVLDEPSIGLHQSDNTKLIKLLKQMVEIGNTLIVVEHDEETIMEADYIVDIGPKAGDQGGQIIAQGTVKEVADNDDSITGQYLSGKKKIEVPKTRRKGNGLFIELQGVTENNLKNVNVKFPLGKLVAITGVSGSGKSTLINEVLVKTIEKNLNLSSHVKPGKHKNIIGINNIDKIIRVSQSPIGKTPRSNPATYTSLFDDIRDIFASVELSRSRGYDKGRFSFNVPGGRCDKCQGDGSIKIEMQFLPTVYITCDHCDGKKYNYETLEVKYKGKTIFDVLNMRVTEALNFFSNRAKLYNKIKILEDVGLGYIKLGQSATTLSGGEAQRIKLAAHLQKKPTGKTLYVLDEPTTGLHTYDVQNLLNILNRIVDNKDTVIVIEHNLDVIKSCDHIIDLGPKGGVKGGQIIAQGTPEEVAKNEKSLTAKYLDKLL